MIIYLVISLISLSENLINESSLATGKNDTIETVKVDDGNLNPNHFQEKENIEYIKKAKIAMKMLKYYEKKEKIQNENANTSLRKHRVANILDQIRQWDQPKPTRAPKLTGSSFFLIFVCIVCITLTIYAMLFRDPRKKKNKSDQDDDERRPFKHNKMNQPYPDLATQGFSKV